MLKSIDTNGKSYVIVAEYRKIYDLLRANNVRQWEQQRNKQQEQ